MQFHDLYDELIAEGTRNQLIFDDVVQAVQEGRSPLILTERNEHLDRMAGLLPASNCHLVVLRGGMGRKEIRETIERPAAIPESESRVLLATGRYVDEGFDDARLDTLFLTLPVSWRGTIAQHVGLHRLHHCKREVAYLGDDLPVGSVGYRREGTGPELPHVPGDPLGLILFCSRRKSGWSRYDLGLILPKKPSRATLFPPSIDRGPIEATGAGGCTAETGMMISAVDRRSTSRIRLKYRAELDPNQVLCP
jgi:hypothetical protein